MALFTNNKEYSKVLIALRDSFIIFMFLFFSMVLESITVHNELPSALSITIILLSCGLAFITSFAGKLDIDLTPK